MFRVELLIRRYQRFPYLRSYTHRTQYCNDTWQTSIPAERNARMRMLDVTPYPEQPYTKLWHDDAIQLKYFPRYWPFVRGIHRSPVNSQHKGQWRGALMFSLIFTWINGWVNIVRLVIWDAIGPIVTSLQWIPYKKRTQPMLSLLHLFSGQVVCGKNTKNPVSSVP